ncbi:hypothetical protein D3C81_2232230 [compost metagenome]
MEPLPEVEYVTRPGSALARATSDGKSCNGEPAPTTSRKGVVATVATVAKSLTESKGILLYRLWFTAWEPAYVSSSV